MSASLREDEAPNLEWVEAFRQIITSGTAASTRLAHERDIEYFWSWAALRLQCLPKYPISKNLLMQFLIDHRGHMPAAIEAALLAQDKRKRPGQLAICTLRRLVGSLSVMHDELGVPNYCRDPQVRLLLTKARNASAEVSRKKAAITSNILMDMLATCTDDLRGLRDRALLLVGFSTGGRRRSELSAFVVSDLTQVSSGYLLRVRRSKTDQAGRGMDVPLSGEGARALEKWLQTSGLIDGRLFRGVHRSGHLTKGLTGTAINKIVKRRVAMVGLDPSLYGAHSLRSGFMTAAARHGIDLQDAMALSGHRSERIAIGYYRPETLFANPAARLMDRTKLPYGLLCDDN